MEERLEKQKVGWKGSSLEIEASGRLEQNKNS